MAMDHKVEEAAEKVDLCCDGCGLFRIAKQGVGGEKDVGGVNYLKDESEAVKVSKDNRKKILQEHMEKLMNVEN